MYKNLQFLFLLLPARLLAQSLHGELSGCDDPYCLYEHGIYSYDHRRTVSLFDLPAKPNPVILSPGTRPLTGDPQADRLKKRMDPIITDPLVTITNTTPFDMAPGLAPKSR